MPEKRKTYERVIFTPEVIKQTEQVLVAKLSGSDRKVTGQSLSVSLSSGEEWEYDDEEEFFADYRKEIRRARFSRYYGWGKGGHLSFSVWSDETEVAISMSNRSDVEAVFGILDSNIEGCRLPEPSPKKIRVFIGHGLNPQWRDLKDHLHEKHRLEVEAYEIGARAGLTIKEVLDDMLTSSSFALLVLTGEDEDAKGKLHARENVIHELGLFQGRLGWRKAIALLEEGVEEFSNIHGINQIRFSKSNIRETFGEVLATIKREFSEKESRR